MLVSSIEISVFRASWILGFDSRRNSSVGCLFFGFAAVLESFSLDFGVPWESSLH